MSDLEHDVLSEIAEEVESLSPEALREELRSVLAAEGKRKERLKEYNDRPEVKEKRQAYYLNPDNKAKRQAYQQKRNARHKLLLQKARESGLDKEVDAELAAEEGLGAEV